AFWISVVVHLTLIILVVNGPRIERYLPRRAVIAVSPNDMMRQKELTYLELPADEQKLTKPPETDHISDKNRVATSRAPQLDRQESSPSQAAKRSPCPRGRRLNRPGVRPSPIAAATVEITAISV